MAFTLEPARVRRADQAKMIGMSATRLAELARRRLGEADRVTNEEERARIFEDVKTLVDEVGVLNETARSLLS